MIEAEERLHETFEDPRLRPLHARPDCFLCGQPITRPSEGCYAQAQNAALAVRLAAHNSCCNGMDDFDLATRIQIASFSAVSGKKERTH